MFHIENNPVDVWFIHLVYFLTVNEVISLNPSALKAESYGSVSNIIFHSSQTWVNKKNHSKCINDDKQ